MRRKSMKQVVVIGAVSAVLLGGLSPGEALAETKYWEPAGGTGAWGYAAHWDPDGIPQAGDTAAIEATGDGWTLECTYINPAFNKILQYLADSAAVMHDNFHICSFVPPREKPFIVRFVDLSPQLRSNRDSSRVAHIIGN